MVALRQCPERAERAELWRQGAKAAARGEDSASNPMLHADNLPPITGESAELWQRRRTAWQAGFEWSLHMAAARRRNARRSAS